MFKITEKGRMILTRGDSCDFTIDLYNADGTPYVPATNDIILFSLKNHIYDEEPVLTKEGLTVEFDSDDTKDLNVGTYYYDIKVLFEDGSVQTVFPTNYFEIRYNVGDWDGQDTSSN